MNVAGAQLHGPFEQVVDRAHDRRTARQIAQILDIVVGMREIRFGGIGRRQIFLAQAGGQNGGDVLERGNHRAHSTAEHDLGGAHRRRVDRVADGKAITAVGGLKRENRHLEQKAARKAPDQRPCFHQLGKAHAPRPIEARDLIGEVVGR